MTARLDEGRGVARAAPLPSRPGADPRGEVGPGRRTRRPRRSRSSTSPLTIGTVTLWLSIIVLLPLAALVVASFEEGWSGFWEAVTAPAALATLWVTVWVSAVVALVNAVMGTLIAWVLVRDDFRGKRALNALIDLPFALPTIVAGIVLLALYGEAIAFTKQAGGSFLIAVMRPDGSGERVLTEGFHNEGPTWAPNGRVLMFFRESRGANGGPKLFSVDLTGYNEREVPTPAFGSDPAWSPLRN